MWLLQLFLFISVCCYVGGGELNMQCPAKGSINSEPCGLSRDADGYEYKPGLGYYKFYSKTMTWFDAKAKCHEDGGHLAIVNSNEEATVLAKLFAEHIDYHMDTISTDYQAYIGASDIRKEGEFVTVFGQRLECAGYTKWNESQPDDWGNGEDCVLFRRDLKMNDIDCNRDYGFFCEKPLKRFLPMS